MTLPIRIVLNEDFMLAPSGENGGTPETDILSDFVPFVQSGADTTGSGASGGEPQDMVCLFTNMCTDDRIRGRRAVGRRRIFGNLVEMEKSLLGVSSDSHARGCIKCTPVRHLNCMTLSRSVCCWLGRVLGFRERWGECWRSIGAQPQAARARGLPRWRFRRWFSISPSALGLRRDRPSPGDRSRASRRSAAWACRRSTDGSAGRR